MARLKTIRSLDIAAPPLYLAAGRLAAGEHAKALTADSLSNSLSESGLTLLTKLPPATPGILRISPALTSAPSVSRMVGRLTPNC